MNNTQELLIRIGSYRHRSQFISGDIDIEYFSEEDADFFGSIDFCTSESDYDDGYNNIEVVYHFPKWDCHVQMNGYYASHHGYEFTDCCLVEPEEYTAIRYNKI